MQYSAECSGRVIKKRCCCAKQNFGLCSKQSAAGMAQASLLVSYINKLLVLLFAEPLDPLSSNLPLFANDLETCGPQNNVYRILRVLSTDCRCAQA